MLNKFQLKQSVADMSLFFRQKGRQISGMVGSYVDDLLCASPSNLRRSHEGEFLDRFECKDPKDLPMTVFYSLVTLLSDLFQVHRRRSLYKLVLRREQPSY
jgi:hypothetical protein